MIRHTTLAAAAGLLAALAAASVAHALPLAKSPATPQGIVEQAGGHAGRGGGGGGPRFHGGGGPRFHGGGGPRFHGGGHGPRFHGGPRFRGFSPYYGYGGFGAYPYYFNDFDDDDSYADCAPLRRRALATGSRVWWNRYYACIED
ncbi:MAG: hypothetical protein WDN31_20160 [Hyphomicrobium sp.]